MKTKPKKEDVLFFHEMKMAKKLELPRKQLNISIFGNFKSSFINIDNFNDN